MRNGILTLAILMLLGLSSAFAQSSNDPIIIRKATLGHDYYQAETRIRESKEIKEIVASNKSALKEVRKSIAAEHSAYVFACLGGAVIGRSAVFVSQTGFDTFETCVLAGGFASIAVSVGMLCLSDYYRNKGVTIYNTQFGTTAELDFGLVNGGIGFTLSF